MKVKLITPENCTDEELSSFYELVIQGDQVNESGLLERIKTCRLLGFAFHNNELVAVSAIKIPSEVYKSRVFKKAGVESISINFQFEIGYAFTKKAFRGLGIHQRLLQAFFEFCNQENFYATTKALNVPHILVKLGFEKTGNDYKNDDNEVLQLFTYYKRSEKQL